MSVSNLSKRRPAHLGLNTLTGRLLWKTAVGLHQNGDLPRVMGLTTILPGTIGGVLTPPASAEGVVYVAALMLHRRESVIKRPTVGNMLGDVVAMSDPTGGMTIVNNMVHSYLSGKDLALNRATGALVWSY